MEYFSFINFYLNHTDIVPKSFDSIGLGQAVCMYILNGITVESDTFQVVRIIFLVSNL